MNFTDASSQSTASTSSQPMPSEPSSSHASTTPNTPNNMINFNVSQSVPIPQSQDMIHNQMMFWQYLHFSNPNMFSNFQQQPMFGMANGMPVMPNGMPGMLPPNDPSIIGMNGMHPNMFMPNMFNPMAMGMQTGMSGMADMSMFVPGFSESHTELPDASVTTPKIEPSSSPLPKKRDNSQVVKRSKKRDTETPRSSEQPSASTSRVPTPSSTQTQTKARPIFNAGRSPKAFFVELGIHRRQEVVATIKVISCPCHPSIHDSSSIHRKTVVSLFQLSKRQTMQSSIRRRLKTQSTSWRALYWKTYPRFPPNFPRLALMLGRSLTTPTTLSKCPLASRSNGKSRTKFRHGSQSPALGRCLQVFLIRRFR